MVKNIVGYNIVFSGKAEERRKPIRLSVESTLQIMGDYIKGHKVLIRGNVYQNWEVASFEKIIGSQLDVHRAIRDHHTVISEDELKDLIQGMSVQPVLPVSLPKQLQ